jgi:hypothetical protein
MIINKNIANKLLEYFSLVDELLEINITIYNETSATRKKNLQNRRKAVIRKLKQLTNIYSKQINTRTDPEIKFITC